MLREKDRFAIFGQTGKTKKLVSKMSSSCHSIGYSMRFSQLDRIYAIEPGKSISAVKCLSLSEAYLQDHFPRFPVMPGVLMLESLFQASMWLARVTSEFKYSSVVLRETRSVKFQGFVQPGDQLLVGAEIKKTEDSLTHLKVTGSVNDRVAVAGRMVVDSFNLAERRQLDPAIDEFMKLKFRLTFLRLSNQLESNHPVATGAAPTA